MFPPFQEKAKEESGSKGQVDKSIEEPQEEIGELIRTLKVGFDLRIAHAHGVESDVGSEG